VLAEAKTSKFEINIRRGKDRLKITADNVGGDGAGDPEAVRREVTGRAVSGFWWYLRIG
jgi:hypothetical protein